MAVSGELRLATTGVEVVVRGDNEREMLMMFELLVDKTRHIRGYRHGGDAEDGEVRHKKKSTGATKFVAPAVQAGLVTEDELRQAKATGNDIQLVAQRKKERPELAKKLLELVGEVGAD